MAVRNGYNMTKHRHSHVAVKGVFVEGCTRCAEMLEYNQETEELKNSDRPGNTLLKRGRCTKDLHDIKLLSDIHFTKNSASCAKCWRDARPPIWTNPARLRYLEARYGGSN